jgi:plastocyanin
MNTMLYQLVKKLGLVLIGLIVFGGMTNAGLSVDDQSETSNDDPTEVTIVGKKMEFSPSEFSANAGDEITITFKNEGRLPHNIGVMKKGSSVEDFDKEDLIVLSETIQGGNSIDVSFTIDNPGEYTFVCNIPGHARAGMTGTLVIE